MYVRELWRYPVKSLRGEQLDTVELLPGGIPGDRAIHVQAANGRIVTARTHPRLLGLNGNLGEDGEPTVNGETWDSPASQKAIAAVAGAGASLRRSHGQSFDVLPLSILSDGAIAALGVDHRRLRPNVVIGGVEGLAERGWPGRQMLIGETIVQLVKLRERCVMPTYDPDTLEQELGVLRRIVRDFNGVLSLDAFVLRGGRVRVGDSVRLLDAA